MMYVLYYLAIGIAFAGLMMFTRKNETRKEDLLTLMCMFGIITLSWPAGVILFVSVMVKTIMAEFKKK